MLPDWLVEYIGLPFAEKGRDRAGLDCWGLVRLVLREQYSINVPSYCDQYKHTMAVDTLGGLISRECQEWAPVENVKAGDVIVMRMRGQPMHVGLVVSQDLMLHIERGIDSCLENFKSGRWNRRIIGVYRYKAGGVDMRIRNDTGRMAAVSIEANPGTGKDISVLIDGQNNGQ